MTPMILSQFDKIDELSPSELNVFKLMTRGMKNREMADILCVTEKTVKFHNTHIYKKLGLNRFEILSKVIKTLDSKPKKYDTLPQGSDHEVR